MKETPPVYPVKETGDLPSCFGDGDTVCPVDEDGIMQPRKECLACSYLRPCLRGVMVERGKLRIVDDPPGSKVTGFLRRWSDRKLKNKSESASRQILLEQGERSGL